jgi:hypothetical protein
MTDEYMTLAEALATGLPFKHKNWARFVDASDNIAGMPVELMYEPVWQVQRPKKKLRVWAHVSDGSVVIKDNVLNSDWQDITQQLKDILKDSDNG